MAFTSIKHLSSIANDVVQTCALKVGSSVEELKKEFEGIVWKMNENKEYGEESEIIYSRKFIEYCFAKAVKELCSEKLDEKIVDGSFSRFTFHAMLAWEMPSHHQPYSMENVAKGREDRKRSSSFSRNNNNKNNASLEQSDDIPLFYSDIMPLLVNEEEGCSVGEDAYVWLGSLVPLMTDVVNGRFTFETLTLPTMNRLHFPAYDHFLREIHKTIKHLQKQGTPKGVELGDFEFILHVDGTATSHRVIRHIGGTSWPGRLTLTNYALYFEASGVISYEDALKIDLSKTNIEHSLKPAATGPWGVPLFDKAVVYESSELPEGIVFEFPEMTSSTRRDHWLALTKEILLMHQFLSTFNVTSPIQEWEMHARTILCIVRLHAAREMLRISPPDPTKFLIFALFEEIPKGDYVLQKLAESLKHVGSGNPCSATSILRQMNVREEQITSSDLGQDLRKEILRGTLEKSSSLESAIREARKEEKKIAVAKATTEELKEEGIADSILVLIGLLKPLTNIYRWFLQIFVWERPAITLLVIASSLIIAYKEWVGKGVAVVLFWVVAKMINARRKKESGDWNEIKVCKTPSDKSTMESVVSAQHGLRTLYESVQMLNICLLKIWSIFISKTPKHADLVMAVLISVGILIAIIPSKFIIMAIIIYCFIMTSKIGQNMGSNQGNRRLKEWWDSIPVIPVRILQN